MEMNNTGAKMQRVTPEGIKAAFKAVGLSLLEREGDLWRDPETGRVGTLVEIAEGWQEDARKASGKTGAGPDAGKAKH